MKKNIITLIILLNANLLFSNTLLVSTILALQSAINNASAGDTIALANGTYLNNTINIGTSNITIQPQTNGGVLLNGTNAIIINGNNVSLIGFQFTSGTIANSAITVNGNNNTLTQLNFNGYDATHMLIIYGQNNLLSYSNFQNKPAPNMVNHGGTGDMVQIIPNATIVGYNTIRYCSFKHMPGFGGDFGNECIRIGDGAYSTNISRTVVEYCYFEDTGNGDSEAISVKSRENCLRFNTMMNNPNAMFSFRNGDNNVAYSNFFINSGGIRCKQSNSIYCYNNYFQNSGKHQNLFLPGSGTAPVFLEYVGTGFGDNFNFIYNTFFKCIDIKIASGLTNCTWANNIFYSDSSTIFSGINSGQSYAGNLYQGNIGFNISLGMNNTNPQLIPNSSGNFSLSSSSPAIGNSSSNYPSILNITGLNNDANILYDIEGQSRPATVTLKDVGCNQYSNVTINNYPLDSCQVGPSYLCTAYTSLKTIQNNIENFTVYPNPSTNQLNIQCRHCEERSNLSNIVMYDILGNEVNNINSSLLGSLGGASINIENLASGIYTITINTNHSKSNHKFIKN